MRLAFIAVTVTMLTAPSLAEPDPVRCARGERFAQAGDLPRAALYLDGCTGEAAERSAAEVARKLRASQLSALNVVAGAASVAFETDAMPGEPLATPATIWAKAGTYTIRANGRVVAQTLPAHARATVVLSEPAHVAAPTAGNVNFNDEPTDPPVSGPPPAVKHPSLLPCKYEGCDTHGGEVLADPFARGADHTPAHPPRARLGVRVGLAGSERIAPSFALAGRLALPWQDAAAHPFELALRADGSPRERDAMRFTDLGLSLGVARVLAAPDAAWLSLAVALRGDLRAGAPTSLARTALGATAELELELRALPATLAARYEQGFAGEHAVVIELGVDLRRFR